MTDRITLNLARPLTVTQTTETVPGEGLYWVVNGHRIAQITMSGHLHRLSGLPAEVGLRRLPDGRVAIKPRSPQATF